MGLFSGLEKFGIKDVKEADIFEEPKKTSQSATSQKEEKKQVSEEDMLFDKKYSCVVCGKEITTKTIRIGKAKLLQTDIDLRPKYQGIDPLKYDVIACNSCGYAALTRYYNALSDPQVILIRNEITPSFRYVPPHKEAAVISYTDAIAKHKLALYNAVVKRAKASEKAYICLKTAWLNRGLLEEMSETEGEKYETIKQEELECLAEAYKGFVTAISSESSSNICGMDIGTVEYLCAAIAYEIEDYAGAQKLISRILSSGANRRMKDKTLELKDLIMEKIRETHASEKEETAE